MNHTPETPQSHDEAQASVNRNRKPPCGWCVSTHIADIKCICVEPCVNERTGEPVGWCTAIKCEDPFSVQFCKQETR